MPHLSIKNVPEAVVAKLRERAAGNHRSLQGELLALVCRSAEGDRTGQGGDGRSVPPEGEQSAQESGWMTVQDILAKQTASGLKTVPGSPRGVDIVRRDRDAR